MIRIECHRCHVGFDDEKQIACICPSGEIEGEPEFIWCCVECLIPQDLVCSKNECKVD